ncbi:hypothetical protein HPB50_016595 [Hyalomma asiaticum]|uniref:Uncharacterized protein n=1 Tax=Hyalomma asiaticum TaxID=266040 RepID=A0ACB7S142_HYAAI|nr:hypothetical protein HPB50_016595 [Hyalomma asiaticum]
MFEGRLGTGLAYSRNTGGVSLKVGGVTSERWTRGRRQGVDRWTPPNNGPVGREERARTPRFIGRRRRQRCDAPDVSRCAFSTISDASSHGEGGSGKVLACSTKHATVASFTLSASKEKTRGLREGTLSSNAGRLLSASAYAQSPW